MKDRNHHLAAKSSEIGSGYRVSKGVRAASGPSEARMARITSTVGCAGTASFTFSVLLQLVDGPNVSRVLLGIGSAACALVAVVSLLVVLVMLG